MKKLEAHKVKKVSRRKYNNGWTYSEARKNWRMTQREAKLNKGWARCSFKEFIESMIFIRFN